MQTVQTKTAGDVKPETLARCLWCKSRIGETRYRWRGRWQAKCFENSLAIWLAGEEITDGICPDCYDEQVKQITALRFN